MTGLSSPFRTPAPSARPARPLLVELVGPAAVGKSSVLRALAQHDLGCRLGMRLPKYRHVWSVAALIPTFLALHRSAPGVLWKEMKRMVYLQTLKRAVLLERMRQRAVVLDEGAVYMLARMRVYGGTSLHSRAFESWWREATEAWARTFDLLVWLDAPDAVLMERLRTRSRYHRMQVASDATIRRFLGTYRAAYADLMISFAAESGLPLLEFRTDREPPGRIADQLAAELCERGGTGP
jgi:shikimate kinase